MSTHNICFCGEIRKILCGYSLLTGTMLSHYALVIYDIWTYHEKSILVVDFTDESSQN